MDGQNPITNLGLACPYGGNFYICWDSPTQFIGCCKSDPCGERKGLCPDEHLRSASFEAKQYNQILPQACINDNRDVKWYTCAGTTPSFLGCCAVNPCAKGACPARELRAAKLSDNSKNAEPFRGGGSPPDPVSSSSSSSSTESSQTISSFTTSYLTTTTTDTATSVTGTNTSEAGTDAPGGHKKLDDGAIAAIAIGTIIFILVIFGLLYCARRERKRERQDIKDLQNRQENASMEKNISGGKTNEKVSDDNSDKPFMAELEQPPDRNHLVCNHDRNEAAQQTHHPQQGRRKPQGPRTQNESPTPSPPTPSPHRQAHDGNSLVSKPSDWSLNQANRGPEASLDPLSAHFPHPRGSRAYTPSQSPSPQPATAFSANNWFQTKTLGNTGRQNRGNSPFAPDPDTQSRGNTPPTILSNFNHNIRKQNQTSPGVSERPSRERYASTTTGMSGATVPFVLQEHTPVAGTLPA